MKTARVETSVKQKNNISISKNNKTLPIKTLQLCERIKSFRKMIKMSQKDFAATAGISQGHLCIIEKGEQAPSDTLLLAICYRHKVSEKWLMTGIGDPFAPSTPDQGIPIYGQFPGFCTDMSGHGEVIGYLLLPNISLGAFAFYQRGDFMAPTIQAQDLVICDPSCNNIVNDDLLLVKNKWKCCIIRRCRKTDSKAMLTADNPAYNPFELDDENLVVAKVIKVMRNVNL